MHIDEEPSDECLTALGGIPLFVRTGRSLDVPGSVKRNLAIKQRDCGFDEPTHVESLDRKRRFAVRTNLWDWKPKRLLEWHRSRSPACLSTDYGQMRPW